MHKKLTLLVTLLFVLAVQGAFYGFSGTVDPDRMIVGPDSFMRLHRVEHLHQSGAWYDAHDPHTNAPYGETLHWTRPMDALLYAGAWVGSAFTDFRSALMWWGIALSPLIVIAMVLLWSWTTRALLSDGVFLLSAAMLVLLPQLNSAFRLGRPDHHSLLLLLFFAQLGILVRVAMDRDTTRLVAVAGGLAAAAMWVSVEALTYMLLFCATLGVFWLWQGGDHVRRLAVYLGSMAVCLTVALALERPPVDWLTAQYDRLSIVHWTLVAVGAAVWTAIHLTHARWGMEEGVRRRVLAGLVGCAVPGAVMLALFPKFFGGPFAELQSAAFSEWVASISEYTSIMPVDRFTTGMFLVHLGPALIALAYMLLGWKSADAAHRRLFVMWLLGFAIYLPLALDAVRWATYAQILLWLPWALAIVALMERPWVLKLRRVSLPLRPLFVPAAITGPALMAAAVLPTATIEAKITEAASCDWRGMAAHLGSIRGSGGKDPIVLTHLFQGPQIVWRTLLRVVGAPYGNAASIEDTNTVFRARDDAAAHAVIDRRRIDLVLICKPDAESRRYRGKGQRSLFSRLERGEPPAWLERQNLPPGFAEAFRLYRVIR